MSISNLNNRHFNDQQIEAIKNVLKELETQLEFLVVNLTPEERNKYGRVNEQNKLFINKVYDFVQEQPALRSPDVNWDEFMADYTSREFLEMLIVRLSSLITRAKNAKTLHDFDNYQDALNDYAYTSFRAGSNAVGFEDKHKELRQFFVKNRYGEVAKNDIEDKNDTSSEE